MRRPIGSREQRAQTAFGTRGLLLHPFMSDALNNDIPPPAAVAPAVVPVEGGAPSVANNSSNTAAPSIQPMDPEAGQYDDAAESDDEDEGGGKRKRGGHGRRKIEIEYIDDKIRRHITFSKRKAGISKKAYELSRLTGAQVNLQPQSPC